MLQPAAVVAVVDPPVVDPPVVDPPVVVSSEVDRRVVVGSVVV